MHYNYFNNYNYIYDFNNYLNALYLRLEVKDKPGVLSSITKQLAKYNISVKRLIQIPEHKKKTASIAIITHEANELNSKKCLKSFKTPSLLKLIGQIDHIIFLS